MRNPHSLKVAVWHYLMADVVAAIALGGASELALWALLGSRKVAFTGGWSGILIEAAFTWCAVWFSSRVLMDPKVRHSAAVVAALSAAFSLLTILFLAPFLGYFAGLAKTTPSVLMARDAAHLATFFAATWFYWSGTTISSIVRDASR